MWSDCPAFVAYVELVVKNSYARFSDNYFHLIPSETKTVYVVSSEVSEEEFRKKFYIKSLIDTYSFSNCINQTLEKN